MKSRSIIFSRRAIEALPIPRRENSSSGVEYSDSRQMGLKLAVYHSGRRVFRHRFTIDGKKRAVTLGEFPAMTIDEARERVRMNRQKILDGEDPRAPAGSDMSFSEFAEDVYIPFARLERRSFPDILSRLRGRLIPIFGDFSLARITRAQVIKFHTDLAGEVSATTANRSLALLSSVFSRAVSCGFITHSPTHGVTKLPEPSSRIRCLSAAELRRFMAALERRLGDSQARAIYLLLALGLRKMEVLALRWEHVDFETERIFLPRTKSGSPRHVSVNSLALDLLREMDEERDPDAVWVFPSRSASGHLREVRRTFNAILLEAQIEDFRLHDLRHSFASNLVNAGVSIYELRDLLGHADVRTTQIYAHLGSPTLRRASETSAKILREALGSS
jgi:integrase